jgi:alkyl hydroperoxide reductase subunit AhpF
VLAKGGRAAKKAATKSSCYWVPMLQRVTGRTGVVPNTRWLGGCVDLDAEGFVLRCRDVRGEGRPRHVDAAEHGVP